VFTLSCASKRVRKPQQQTPVQVAETAVAASLYLEEDVNPRSPAYGFEPFDVEQVDGFYEVFEFEAGYPFKNVVLAEEPVVTKSDIEKAKTGFDDYIGRPVINIELTEEGATKFEDLTEENIGKPIAIVIGKKVIMMPVVNEKIPGGRIQISGNFTLEEVKEMVKVLKSK